MRRFSTGRKRDQARNMVKAEKIRRVSCVDCGLLVTEENSTAFDFDHRDRSEKKHTISDLQARAIDFERLIAEMAKCDLRCAICHRVKTYRERDFVHLHMTEKPHPSLFEDGTL